MALVSTTDFYANCRWCIRFWSIASANAISDVWAMGGKPLLAIAILDGLLKRFRKPGTGSIERSKKYLCWSRNTIGWRPQHWYQRTHVWAGSYRDTSHWKCWKRNNTKPEKETLFLTKPSLNRYGLSTAQKGRIKRRTCWLILKWQTEQTGEAPGKINAVSATQM